MGADWGAVEKWTGSCSGKSHEMVGDPASSGYEWTDEVSCTFTLVRKPQPNNGTPYIWEGTGKADASHTGRGWGLSAGSETGQANLEIAVSLGIDPPSGSYSLSLGGDTSYPITVVDGDGTHTDKASVSWDDP